MMRVEIFVAILLLIVGPVDAQTTIQGNLARSIDVACSDLDDLPMSGSCPSQGLDLRFYHARGWPDGGAPAGFRCNYGNPISADQTGEASITCIALP